MTEQTIKSFCDNHEVSITDGECFIDGQKYGSSTSKNAFFIMISAIEDYAVKTTIARFKKHRS